MLAGAAQEVVAADDGRLVEQGDVRRSLERRGGLVERLVGQVRDRLAGVGPGDEQQVDRSAVELRLPGVLGRGWTASTRSAVLVRCSTSKGPSPTATIEAL